MNRRSIARVSLVALVLAGAGWLWLVRNELDPAALDTQLQAFGAWAPAVFIASFALGTIFFVPGSLFGLAGGVLFGPLWGTLWNIAGGTLGASVAFLIARYLAGDWTARITGPRLKTIMDGVQAEGWRFVALTRLVPIVPFNLLNYALGSTRIALPQYVIATLVCMLPGAAAYAWLGHAGRAAMTGIDEAMTYAFAALALLALIAFAPRLVRRLRTAPAGWISVPELKRRMDSGAPLMVIDVREPAEFVGPLGHIQGARNIPMADLAAHLDEIKLQDATTTVLVCKTDKRSSKAASVLRAAGVQNVSVLRGGMEAWNGTGPLDPDRRAARC